MKIAEWVLYGLAFFVMVIRTVMKRRLGELWKGLEFAYGMSLGLLVLSMLTEPVYHSLYKGGVPEKLQTAGECVNIFSSLALIWILFPRKVFRRG
jgi:hypothetical protein